MGTGDEAVVRAVTAAETPSARDEIELTLFGPGYGESVVLHIGDGAVVDSCIDKDGRPSALSYLENLDPAEVVVLVAATRRPYSRAVGKGIRQG